MSSEVAEKLFRQKSLYDIYKITKYFDDTPFNRRVFWLLVVLSAALISWVYCEGALNVKASDSLKFVQISATYGAQLSMTILGFLISGFAIFSSLTKPELFMKLASIKHKWKGVEITELQYLFFNFLNAFIIYLSLLFVCTLVTSFSADGSPLSTLHQSAFPFSSKRIVFFNSLFSIAIMLFVARCLLVLKSFIWNMYQAVLIIILADAAMKSEVD